METQKIIEDLKARFPEFILSAETQFGDDILLIDRHALLDIVRFLMEEPYEFAMLLDLTCVDYLGEEPRFEMVYYLFSLAHKLRLRLKARVPEDEPEIASMTSVFKNANWLEREVFDMFGIRFEGHPYLRRLFMYDGFEGHPLRKDYPLRKQQPRIRLKE
ncbi:MAG: NADH-quinone oxidoreductase subunit C [Candidatus Aminicenantales bacterium]